MPRRNGLRPLALGLFACLALVALVGAVTSASAATEAGIATKSCNPPAFPGGNGYITSLKVTGVSCRTGGKVAQDYQRCRHRHGGAKGRCTSRVDGYRCTEGRRYAIATEFDARVTCKRGTKRVVHTYQQNT